MSVPHELTAEEIEKFDALFSDHQKPFLQKIIAVDELLELGSSLNRGDLEFNKISFSSPQAKQALLKGHKAIFEITNALLGHFADLTDKEAPIEEVAEEPSE
jgi:hypothetical protein